MILIMIFILFSLSYSNLTIICFVLPKCRLCPLLTFLSTKLHILHSFLYTYFIIHFYPLNYIFSIDFIHIFYYICTFLSTKQHILHSFYTRILLYSLSNTVVPMKHLSLLNLPNYSNFQFTNPFYHPNIHWIPTPTSTSVDIHSNSQPISSIPNWSPSNLFQLLSHHPNPNSSNPDIG